MKRLLAVPLILAVLATPSAAHADGPFICNWLSPDTGRQIHSITVDISVHEPETWNGFAGPESHPEGWMYHRYSSFNGQLTKVLWFRKGRREDPERKPWVRNYGVWSTWVCEYDIAIGFTTRNVWKRNHG